MLKLSILLLFIHTPRNGEEIYLGQPKCFFSSWILTFINYQGKLNANFNMTCVFNKSKENLKMKN